MEYCLLGRQLGNNVVVGSYGQVDPPHTPQMVALVAFRQGWEFVVVFRESVSAKEAQSWMQAGNALSAHPHAKYLIVAEEQS